MPRPRKLPDGMIQRTGRPGYYARFRANGREIREKLGDDFKAAVRLLNKLKADADEDRLGFLNNNAELEALRDQYLDDCRQTLKPYTVATYTIQLKNILDRLKARTVAHVKPESVTAYRKRRLAAGRSPRTVNAEVQALSGMLNWAVEFAVIKSNPLAKIKPLPHDSPRERRPLSDDEVARLLETSPEHWRDVWYTYLVTGLRESELIELTFRDVDLAGRELTIPARHSKNRKPRSIPVDDELHRILSERLNGRGDREPGRSNDGGHAKRIREKFSRDHVFVSRFSTPLTRHSVLRAFKSWCKRAGIEIETLDSQGRLLEHVDVHSLRVTFATNLITNGADPKTVQELLGHATLAMTMKIYTKVRSQTKRQAVARLSYGSGALAPTGIVELPSPGVFSENAHQMRTKAEVSGQAQSGA